MTAVAGISPHTSSAPLAAIGAADVVAAGGVGALDGVVVEDPFVAFGVVPPLWPDPLEQAAITTIIPPLMVVMADIRLARPRR
ncbi:MAG: hypothetical protein ABI137_08830 [Antricoccus sp.]